MFTGLVEAQGKVLGAARREGGVRLVIAADFPPGAVTAGESVAVDGACLTVRPTTRSAFEADVIQETLSRTTLGTLRPGDTVHLERALAVGDRLGGHWVQGHVDAVAKVTTARRSGGDVRLEIALPTSLRPYVAEKGSIALAGVSLTVARVARGRLEVALIPETLRRTRLGRLRPGDRVNVEVDLLARYLAVLMRERRGTAPDPPSRARKR